VPGRTEESREWLRCVADDGRAGCSQIERERCLARLHGMLVRVARAELLRRGGPVPIEGHERDDLAHQAADDAMLAIIRKLGQFRGESRFTTWAYKFVVLEVSAQLGRRFRRHPTVQIGDDAWDRIPDRLGIDPARHAESVELAGALRAGRRAWLDTQRDLQDHVRRATEDPHPPGGSRIPARGVTGRGRPDGGRSPRPASSAEPVRYPLAASPAPKLTPTDGETSRSRCSGATGAGRRARRVRAGSGPGRTLRPRPGGARRVWRTGCAGGS